MTVEQRDLVYRLLAACVLALVVCPVAFVFLGARDLNQNFFRVAIPPYMGAATFLLIRFLARPTERPRRRIVLVLEAVSWLVIVAFLAAVSGVGLTVGLERLGAASEMFLVAVVLCIPVAILRPTTLVRRLARIPKAAATFLFLALVVGAGIAAIAHATSAPRFPGT